MWLGSLAHNNLNCPKNGEVFCWTPHRRNCYSPLTPWNAPETSKVSVFSQPKIIRTFWGRNARAFTPRTNVFKRGEYSSGDQSSLRGYGCSIQSNERVSRSANCMPSGRWATQRRMGCVRIREERHENETPHTYIVAKYDKLESWRKTQIWWWTYMTKNISAKTINL